MLALLAQTWTKTGTPKRSKSVPKRCQKSLRKSIPKRKHFLAFGGSSFSTWFRTSLPERLGTPFLCKTCLQLAHDKSKIDQHAPKLLPMLPEWSRKDSQTAPGSFRIDAQTAQNDSKDPPGNKKMPTSVQPQGAWLPKTSASECELSFRSRFSVLACM